MMKVFVDLRNKGHPDYFMAKLDAVEDIACSCTTSQLDRKVCYQWYTLRFVNQIQPCRVCKLRKLLMIGTNLLKCYIQNTSGSYSSEFLN